LNKIILIIGPSASGKSTYVINNYLKLDAIVKEKPFKYTICNNICLLGDYLVNKRCIGTDTLSMAVLPKLIEFIKENKDKYDILIAEGDRISNRKFFEFISSLNIPVDLYVFNCSLEESIKRRQDSGSNSSETFVKTTITKTNNMKQLGKRLKFNILEKYTGDISKNNTLLF